METIHQCYIHDRHGLLHDIITSGLSIEKCIAKLSDGTTLLHHATRNRDVEMVSALLKRLPIMDFEDMWGIDPITIAAARGYTEIVELFLDRGHKVNCANYLIISPLGCAIQNEHHQVVKLILSRSNLGKIDSKIFVDVAETGNIELFDIVYSYMPISETRAIIQPIVAGQGITINTDQGNIPGQGNVVVKGLTAGSNITISYSNTVEIHNDEMMPESYSLLDIVLHLAKFHTSKHISLLCHIIWKCNIRYNARMIDNALREKASVEYFKSILKRYASDSSLINSRFIFHNLVFYLRHTEKCCNPEEHKRLKEVFELFCVVRYGCEREARLEYDLFAIQGICSRCTHYFIKMLLLSESIEIYSKYNPLIRKVADEITLFDKCYFKLRMTDIQQEIS